MPVVSTELNTDNFASQIMPVRDKENSREKKRKKEKKNVCESDAR